MNRSTCIGLITFLGTVLGTGCSLEQPTPPPPGDSVFVDAVPTSTLAGYTHDPEVYYLLSTGCPFPDCPPPILGEGLPYFEMSKIQGATVLVFDPTTGAPAAFAKEPSSPTGFWNVTGVPARPVGAPFFVAATGSGSLVDPPPMGPPPGGPPPGLLPDGPPPGDGPPPIPAANYQPTVTLRPVQTSSSACYTLEALHVGDNGVLEAVAKYRTSKGLPTAVADLTNPGKFAGVSVFWLNEPGFPGWRFRAPNTTVEASAGITYNIGWAPPGAGPAALKSTRGFFVSETRGSPTGAAVVVIPAGPDAPPAVTYFVVDTITDAAAGRPYGYFPLQLPTVPGQVLAASLTLSPAPTEGGGGPPPPDLAFLCYPPAPGPGGPDSGPPGGPPPGP
ncbi:hypothetical protein [Archangium sp.]|uniref:hypothetical protein n=1 Tax=Archangium sp. TaxID=1872627 RepID=UPI00286AE73B|nr:hypothetical protein [Archangium sp.]